MKRAVFFVVALAVATSSAYAQCTDAEKKALEQFDQTWGEATRSGNRAALEEIYAQEAASHSPLRVQSKAQVIDGAVAQAARARTSGQPAPQVKSDYYMISCTPSTATITHRNVTTTVRDGREQTQYGRSIHVLERRGGRWQVVATTSHPLSDAAIITYFEHEWNDANVRRDVAWMERNLASDFVVVNRTTGQVETKTQSIESLRSGRLRRDSVEMSEVTVNIAGDTAVVTGINHVKGQDEQGKPLDARVRWVDTLMRRDGRWQAVATGSTLIPKQGER